MTEFVARPFKRMSRPYFQARKKKFIKPVSEYNDPLKYFMATITGAGESVNWPVFWNGAHVHYLQEFGRVSNTLKGMDVQPRVEHPGKLPEEPNTLGE